MVAHWIKLDGSAISATCPFIPHLPINWFAASNDKMCYFIIIRDNRTESVLLHGSDACEWQKTPISSGFCGGGAERDRTADLLIAKREGVDVARRQWTASLR
jgi:hypothetical protein